MPAATRPHKNQRFLLLCLNAVTLQVFVRYNYTCTLPLYASSKFRTELRGRIRYMGPLPPSNIINNYNNFINGVKAVCAHVSLVEVKAVCTRIRSVQPFFPWLRGLWTWVSAKRTFVPTEFSPSSTEELLV